MAYISLYRRRRPVTFADMTGQEHITQTLSNALSRGRVAHAYLFSGPRGTGKTTAAKIMARAMNCEKYPVSEPCGKCRSCVNIAAGVSMDVIEMDAASNRGIDEIRDLREKTRFASGEGRFRVYIIDEAHMLTPEACNAFLKTLEEPPQNVVFILATTDPSKLTSTIVSRCQRFDFHLLTVGQIKQRLEQVLEAEGWQVEPEALSLIARLSDGSLRDALGILEQCSTYEDKLISADHVRSVTGAAGIELISGLVRSVVDNDLRSGIAALDQLIYSGRDLSLFMRDFTFIFSRLLLEDSDNSSEGFEKDHEFNELIHSYRGKVSQSNLLDAIELLHEVNSELKHSHFPQYVLEISIIRLLRILHGRVQATSFLSHDAAHTTHAIEESVAPSKGKEASEKKPSFSEGSLEEKEALHESSPESLRSDKHIVKEEQAAAVSKSSDTEAEDKVEKLKESWPHLLQELKKRQKSTAAWLEPAQVYECRGALVHLVYNQEYQIHQMRIMEDSHRKLVEEVLSAYFKSPMRVKAEIKDNGDEKSDHKQRHNSEPADYDREGANSENKRKEAPGIEDGLEIFGGKLVDTD